MQSLLTLKEFTQEIQSQHRVWGSVSTDKLLRHFAAISESRKAGMDTDSKLSVPRRAGHFKDSVSLHAPQFEDDDQKSSTTEQFTNLSLELVSEGSVSQALQLYLTETPVEYRCHCGNQLSVQQWSFQTRPNFLVFHLKRFRFTHWGTLEKVRDPVLLSRKLELCSGPPGTPAGCPHIQPQVYTLVSLLSHEGSTIDSGHYISDGAYSSEEGTGENTDRWLSYNDQLVSETSPEHVCWKRQNTAYMLFYQWQGQEMRSLHQPPPPPPRARYGCSGEDLLAMKMMAEGGRLFSVRCAVGVTVATNC
ncbi:hypothetical protein CRUP_038298 [Coryphaenoides rupestris]|nr:hypothetical protein CRUP_038298 [Coryphaenoides rupestris]